MTFSLLLAVYTTGSIVAAFGGATGVFGGMALFGYVTKRDLSGLGAILFGALIGLLIASIVVHLRRRLDVQPDPRLGRRDHLRRPDGLRHAEAQAARRAGHPRRRSPRRSWPIIGALTLYLDFINLALSLLRIFGRTR